MGSKDKNRNDRNQTMSYIWATFAVLAIGIVLGIFLYPFPNARDEIKPHEKQILGMSVNNAKECKQKLSEIKQMAGPDGEVLLNSLKSKTQITLSQGVLKDEFEEFLDDVIKGGTWSEEEKALLRQAKRANLATSVTDLDCNLENGGSCQLSRTHVLSKQYSEGDDKVAKIDLYLGSTKLNFSLKNLEEMAEKDEEGNRWWKWNPLNWNKVEEEKGKKVQIPLEALGHLFLEFTEKEQEEAFYKSVINIINPELARQMGHEQSGGKIEHHTNEKTIPPEEAKAENV